MGRQSGSPNGREPTDLVEKARPQNIHRAQSFMRTTSHPRHGTRMHPASPRPSTRITACNFWGTSNPPSTILQSEKIGQTPQRDARLAAAKRDPKRHATGDPLVGIRSSHRIGRRLLLAFRSSSMIFCRCPSSRRFFACSTTRSHSCRPVWNPGGPLGEEEDLLGRPKPTLSVLAKRLENPGQDYRSQQFHTNQFSRQVLKS